MELLKSIASVIADPFIHVLLFLFTFLLYKPLCRWWTLSIIYLTLLATPVVHKSIASLWSVPNSYNNNIKYDAGLLLLGISDYKWHSKYTPLNRMGFCNLNHNAERAGLALQLLKEKKIKFLLIGQNTIGKFDETACISDMLQQQGIEKDRIIIVGKVRNTLDEIQSTKIFNKNQKLSQLVMITSTRHMRRAQAFAKKENLIIDSLSTKKVIFHGNLEDFIPQSAWIEKSRSLFYEIIAYLGYKITGKL